MAQKTMNCREVGLRIQSYLDGELDESRMAAIASHLDACVDCGLEANVFRQIKSDLTNLSTNSTPSGSEALDRLREFSAEIAERASEAS